MRRARRLAHVALIVAPLGLLAACGDDSKPATDGGGSGKDQPSTATCPNGVDPYTDVESALALTRDTEQDEYICPKGDKDYYKVQLAATEQLLNIKLRPTSPISTVQLSYRLIERDAQGQDKAVGSSPAGVGQFDTLHCLTPGGTYYVVVEDVGNDALDPDNPYKIAFAGVSDKDTNEPNDNDTSATAASGPMTGYISCAGDVDFYQITTSANQLLRIKLETTAPSVVDLKYTLYRREANALVEMATESIPDGSKEPTHIDKTYAVPAPGTYWVKVEDLDGNDSDANTPYTLTLETPVEQDTNDKPTRNDHPKTATDLGATGSPSCASPWTKTITGRLGSVADIDYYKITSAASAGNPHVMSVELKFNGTTKVDPSIELLRESATPCEDDRCCSALGDTSCSDGFDCEGSSFSCVSKGTSFCQNCVTQPAPAGCAQAQSCAGAVLCLASKKCAYSSWARQKTDGQVVRTAQPILQGGPLYLRVADVGGDEYDSDVSYTLTIRVCQDPDGAREPDSGYFPHLTPFPNSEPAVNPPFSADDVGRHYAAKATNALKNRPVAITIPATVGTWSAWIEGTISYEHDEDYFKFANPCPTGQVCLLQAEYATTGNCSSSGNGNGVEFVYTLDKGSFGDDWPRPPAAGASGTYGFDGNASGTCGIFIRDGFASTFVLSVSDLYHNDWDLDCKYRVRFRIMHQGACPVPPCQETGGTCHT